MTSLTVRHILQVYEEDGVKQVRAAVLETSREGKWLVESYRKEIYTVEGFLATSFRNTKGLKGMLEEVKEKAAKLDHEDCIDTKVNPASSWFAQWLRPLLQCFPAFSTLEDVEESSSRFALSPYPAATECRPDDPGIQHRIDIPISETNVRVEVEKSSTRDSHLYDCTPGSLSVSSSVSLRTADLWDDSERRVKELSKLSGVCAYKEPFCLLISDEVTWVEQLVATLAGVYATKVSVENGLDDHKFRRHISWHTLCYGREAALRELIGDTAYDIACNFHERKIQFPHAIYIG